MELRVMSDVALGQLVNDVPAIAGPLLDGSFSLDEYFAGGERDSFEIVDCSCVFPIEIGELEPGEGPAASDLRLSGAFYRTTRMLTRREASDGRLWSTLAIERYRDYVLERFFPERPTIDDLNPRQLATLHSKIQRHLLFHGRPSFKMFDNAVSRLWWLADLALDEQAENPLHLLPVLLTSLDFSERLCRSLLTWNRSTTLGILDAVERFQTLRPEVRSLGTVLVRNLVPFLNRQGPVMAFDAFAREEMADFCLRFLQKM